MGLTVTVTRLVSFIPWWVTSSSIPVFFEPRSRFPKGRSDVRYNDMRGEQVIVLPTMFVSPIDDIRLAECGRRMLTGGAGDRLP